MVTKERMHVRLDILTSKLRNETKRYFDLFLNLIIAFFLIALSLQGVAVMMRASTNELKSPALQIPLELVYSIIFIGALLMLINHLYVMYQDFKSKTIQVDKEE